MSGAFQNRLQYTPQPLKPRMLGVARPQYKILAAFFAHKKLDCGRETARRAVLVEFSSAAKLLHKY